MAGRVVVISGAAGGMGRGICRALATHGDRLVLVDLDRTKLEALTAELEASGATVRACVEDISSDDGHGRGVTSGRWCQFAFTR